jgi:hypothetical protein
MSWEENGVSIYLKSGSEERSDDKTGRGANRINADRLILKEGRAYFALSLEVSLALTVITSCGEDSRWPAGLTRM